MNIHSKKIKINIYYVFTDQINPDEIIVDTCRHSTHVYSILVYTYIQLTTYYYTRLGKNKLDKLLI
jgi:hypothetical protein